MTELTGDEKSLLGLLVKRELERFRKEKKVGDFDASVKWLKAEHDYGHFLEGLMEKLK